MYREARVLCGYRSHHGVHRRTGRWCSAVGALGGHFGSKGDQLLIGFIGFVLGGRGDAIILRRRLCRGESGSLDSLHLGGGCLGVSRNGGDIEGNLTPDGVAAAVRTRHCLVVGTPLNIGATCGHMCHFVRAYLGVTRLELAKSLQGFSIHL